jgi:excisionase family DNA binding protein
VRAARNIWHVQWLDLCAWLDEPTHWMMYDPAACTEPTLREHLIEIRQGRPRWLSIGEVAVQYRVGAHTVHQWVKKGFLPAVRYGNWWIRESDLAGWRIPSERSRAGIPLGMGRKIVGADRVEPRVLIKES